MNNSLKFIYQHPQLSDTELVKIFSEHEKIEVPKNEFLLRENKVANCFYVLESGLVRAFVHDFDQNEITTEFFVENEIVIVPSSLFQRIPSKENLQTLRDSVLWKIEFENFEKLFDQIEGFKDWGRLWFTFQLFATKQRSLEMITETATNRYLKLMKEKPDIIKSAPLKQIASYLGITDSSLSRIRREILYNSKK